MVFSADFGEIFTFSVVEWCVFSFIFIAVLAALGGWAYWLRRRQLQIFQWWKTLLIMATVLLSFFAAHVVHAYADVVGDNAILADSQIIPYFYGLTTKRFLLRHHWVTQDQIEKNNRHQFSVHQSTNMQYPLHALKSVAKQAKPLNVLIIGIDMLRYDALTSAVMPHVYQYGQKNMVFNHHVSGGNCTQPGIFTLFYGIPSNYWQATYNHNVAPVMLRTMKKQGYHLGVFVSAGLVQPPFYRNVFVNVPHLAMSFPGHSAWQQDQSITNDTIHFLQQNKDHRFFAFMFYNAVHDFDFPSTAAKPFTPWWHDIDHLELSNHFNPLPFENRYKNAAYYVDGLVQQVLTKVKQLHLDNNTVVIITTDHGEEFNDNHKDYWGHGSNFTPYQTHIPLVIHWPGMQPKAINYPTSSFDVVPTIMQGIFAVTNPVSDYSVGHSLFTAKPEPVYVMGSYSTLAIVTHNKITTIYPGGYSATTDIHLNPVKQGIPTAQLLQALHLMGRYYHH